MRMCPFCAGIVRISGYLPTSSTPMGSQSTAQASGKENKNLFCSIQCNNLSDTKLPPSDECDMFLFQTDLPETITYFLDNGHPEFSPPEGYTPEQKEVVR